MPKGTKVKESTIEEITSTEEFKKFRSMLEVTEQIDDFDELGTEEQRKIINKFYLWQAKGSPKAEMPKISDDKEDEILSLYRTKYKGQQFIWYVTPDGRTVWREDVHKYAQVEDQDESGNPLGTYHDDTSKIIETKPRYTKPYTKALGDKLVAQAFKYNDQPVFVFEIGGKRFGIDNPLVDFNCEGEQMMEITKAIIQSKRGR
jgi:hypothetical protein